MARKVRVTVDHNVCVGNAMCETIAPKVFVLNEQRQSEAVNPEGDTVEKIWMQQRTVPSAPSSWRMQRQENDCSVISTPRRFRSLSQRRGNEKCSLTCGQRWLSIKPRSNRLEL